MCLDTHIACESYSSDNPFICQQRSCLWYHRAIRFQTRYNWILNKYCEFNNQNKASNLWLQILLWRSKDSLHFYLSTTIMSLIPSSYQISDAIHLDSQYVLLAKFEFTPATKSAICDREYLFLLLDLENFKVCTNSFNRNWSMQCTVKDGSDLITVNFKGRFFGFRDSARVSFQRNLMEKAYFGLRI